jgi:hypothetical protein
VLPCALSTVHGEKSCSGTSRAVASSKTSAASQRPYSTELPSSTGNGLTRLTQLGQPIRLDPPPIGLYANDEPTQIADSYYPWSIARDSIALLQADAGKGGSYSRLAELGHAPARFTEDVKVRMLTDADQRTLDLEGTQPVFEIWHVAYTAEDHPIEVCIHVMPGHVWTLRYGWDDEAPTTALLR